MSKITWSTEKRKISDLKPYFKNPRKLTTEQFQKLKQSLEKFDYVEVAAINLDNTILAGHMRLKVLEKLYGKKHEVDVRVPSRALDEKEVEEYVIRSNKNTGEWDFDILANQFDISELVDWGFSIEEFQVHLESMQDQESEKDAQKDLDEVNLENKLIVEVECLTERDQKNLYDELSKRGYECRILSL